MITLMKKISKTLLLILWMALIFYLSSQNGSASGALSKAILRSFGNFINNIVTIDIEDFVETFSVLIRKAAHFSEYFALYVLSLQCFKEYGVSNILIPLLFCVVYAGSDEIHQLFIDGRAGLLSDVCIDSLGSLISCFICYLINKREWNIT